jgi:CubicO group peptidase (beta-lactamase class C family)
MKKILIASVALIAAAAAHAAPPADLQQRLDALVKGSPGGAAVAWVDADGAVYFQSGTFSSDDPRPITADTQFELGSVSKVFTALLLAQSEREGRVLRLDPAARYLLAPGDPDLAALSKITLLTLTTHTSGLPRLPSNIGPNPDGNPDPYAKYDRAMLVEALRRDGKVAPTGDSMAYSNFGAAVLGEALASAWGVSYAEALTTHVLSPLGMRATSVGLAGLPPPANLAPGHSGGATVPNWTFQAFAPAGAVRSSARDMALFLQAFLGKGGERLRPAMEATLQPQHTADDVGGHIGLGWLIDDDERPVYWHNGATAGSHTFVAFRPATGIAVAILSNIQVSSEALGFSLLGATPPKPKIDRVVDTQAYVGRYSLSPAFAIDITAANGILRVQATGQSQLGMRPVSPDRFAIVGVPAEISFERDGSGRVVALVLHQNGANQRAPRGDLPPPPAEIELPAKTLREYEGSYPLNPSFVITVSEKGGGLYAQATGQPGFQVFASAKDEFFYKIVNAQISFQRDASGRVTGLVLHQNGRNLPAKKAAD